MAQNKTKRKDIHCACHALVLIRQTLNNTVSNTMNLKISGIVGEENDQELTQYLRKDFKFQK